jgi:multidrug resistance efflux pump
MLELILGVYALLVWLIFFKLKLLPWNTTSKVVVFTIPVVGIFVLLQLMNIFTPSSSDVRVVNYVVQVVPRVTARVIEVPVEANRLVKKGEVLLKLDSSQFEIDKRAGEAKLAEAHARLADAEAGSRELGESLKAAQGQVAAVSSNLELAKKRVQQNKELSGAGAGSGFDFEQAQTNLKQLEAQLASAKAQEAQVKEKLSGQIDGEFASIAVAKAQIASADAQIAEAEWKIKECTWYAPSDGYAINVQVRPGSTAAQLPLAPVMSFVEVEQNVIGLFGQNELHAVAPGDEVEIALPTYPGRIIKAKVDSIVWANGQGQMAMGGTLPQTTTQLPPGRFAVKFTIDEHDQPDLFLAAGAVGQGAIYTQHLGAIHIIRKVIIRVGSYVNYLILKLH